MVQLSKPCQVALLLAMQVATFSAQGVGLPDTGQDTCYNGTTSDSVTAADPASIARDAGTFPRQDCRYGRDPATAAGASKTGAGAKGLDYTKIANNGTTLTAGTALGSAATDWACTLDNITGLLWEVKTTSGLRNSTSTYTWYNSNASTNAGNAGTANGGSCTNGTGCDTEKFVSDVNAAALCGYSDWRLPSSRELLTLVLLDGSNPSIDATYFPNTIAGHYWANASYVVSTTNAWYVNMTSVNSGTHYFTTKSTASAVRLVRGTPF